ncbi:hypothetical protein [Campylobacter mucosalis]|uniref:hypothetical protein n=1 Tax=Campylobacter mucosalis TaxID=202 RepID=UPI00147009A8|nr:hypothetical protein [Campylobacter mucosalis]
MFLGDLSENAKIAFLDLAMICARSDGKMEDEEIVVLNQYCDEMDIQMPQKTTKYDYIVDAFENDKDEYKRSIDKIIASLKDETEDFILSALGSIGTQRAKKIYFELLALVYSDGAVTQIEEDILKRLSLYITENDINMLTICASGILSGIKSAKTLELLHLKTKGE